MTTKQLIFITGLSPSEADYKSLSDAIARKWKSPCEKAGYALTMGQWDKTWELVQILRTLVVTKRRIVGFSFGGSAAVDLCFIRDLPTIEKLILLSPVQHPPDGVRDGNDPKFPGFTLPDNVLSALCYHRGREDCKGIHERPIIAGKCPWVNVKYNPKPNPDEKARHGERVWDNDVIKRALE